MYTIYKAFDILLYTIYKAFEYVHLELNRWLFNSYGCLPMLVYCGNELADKAANAASLKLTLDTYITFSANVKTLMKSLFW